jgi:ABC-2 type transport system ATP-binding protein
MALASLSIAWGPGAHAIVGGRLDGGALILALVAGTARPRKGRVRVLDRSPSDAGVRRQVALVTLEPALPETLRVEEILALAALVRAEPPCDAAQRLRLLGIEALAPRTAGSLTAGEARAVAVAEALTSTRVRVALVEEPFLAMDPRAAPRLPEALRAKASGECAVVVTTASHRDASELADDAVLLKAGAIVGEAPSTEDVVAAHAGRAGLRIVVRDAAEARLLVAELAREHTVEAIEHDGSWVLARARDPIALARAAGQAIVKAEVHVAEMKPDPPPFDEPADPAAGRTS